MDKKNVFLPAFGNKPEIIIGREAVTAGFIAGLSCPVGHRQRTSILIGQRGTGKTALLLEFAELAEKKGFVTARVTASGDMLDEIIQTIQIGGAKYVPPQKKVKGLSAGALGFSFGLTFTDETETKYGFRIKLAMLCDELEKHGKGILILVDEVQPNTDQMRSLAVTYQHLIGEGKNLAIVMAGLPSSISNVLNDKILTFLNRAQKIYLTPLSYGDVSIAYATEFDKQGKSIEADSLDRAVKATRGYPYLYQLIGYYILGYAQGKTEIGPAIVEKAVETSKHEMIESVFIAVLAPLSEKDIEFLKAMSEDHGASRIAEITARLKVENPYAQKYRSRLIQAGVIAPAGRGMLAFDIPYLGEYLRGEF